MFNTKKLTFIIVTSIILTGCSAKTRSYSAITPEVEVKTFDLKDCERELQALREVDNNKFTTLEKQFEDMMSGSANYANVRNTINTNTQDTIDSLYHYQSAKVCNDIRVAMLEGLVERAGSVK
ncbi:hypothetical protein [Enterobacter asburiae]|uniref:hypothetical protein n=1 Tax=Enterobacter asburiae TaxID=61645 RepID=UPI000A26C103|nr:hypothetical protein [Enterobacter asburiae]